MEGLDFQRQEPPSTFHRAHRHCLTVGAQYCMPMKLPRIHASFVASEIVLPMANFETWLYILFEPTTRQTERTVLPSIQHISKGLPQERQARVFLS